MDTMGEVSVILPQSTRTIGSTSWLYLTVFCRTRLDVYISKYFCGDSFRVPTLFSSWNFQITNENRNRSVSNEQILIWWMFPLVSEAWIFCYAEFSHATSTQMGNSCWHVIGNLRCFELWMDQGILLEITRGLTKTYPIKNRPKNFLKISSQYCTLFWNCIFFAPYSSTVITLGLSIYSCHNITVE